MAKFELEGVQEAIKDLEKLNELLKITDNNLHAIFEMFTKIMAKIKLANDSSLVD